MSVKTHILVKFNITFHHYIQLQSSTEDTKPRSLSARDKKNESIRGLEANHNK